MIEEYEELLKCFSPIVFDPVKRYFVVKYDMGEGWATIDSEAVGAEFYRYFVRINKPLRLALGYGLESLYGDRLNDLCLEPWKEEYKCL